MKFSAIRKLRKLLKLSRRLWEKFQKAMSMLLESWECTIRWDQVMMYVGYLVLPTFMAHH